MRSVLPSGAARATASAARLPPAPGRFSTRTVRPSARPSSGAMARAIVSVVPPGGAPTRMRTVPGACAKAPPASVREAASTRARRDREGCDCFMISNTEVSLAQAVGREQLRARAGKLDRSVFQHVRALRDLQRLRHVLFHQQDGESLQLKPAAEAGR